MQAGRRIPHEVWEEGTSRGIKIGPWEVETRKQAILNASEVDGATARLGLPLPEITFGNNLVSLKRIGKQRAVDETSQLAEGSAGGLIHIVFDGLHALAQVDTTGQDTIKVSYADAWAKSRRLDTAAGGRNGATAGTTSVIETVKNYDWTYSTTYSGTLEGKEKSFQPASSDHPGIPLGKLARQDEPILFFDEVTLFEDELHDNGVANLTVRIRVMPSGIFLLSRFFLRVDNVLFRIFDVRLYHDFNSNEIIRETKGKEGPYSRVKQHLPQERSDDLTPLTDHNWVANILGMLGKAQTSSSLQDTHLEGATTRQSSRLPSAISPTTDEHIRASWTKATAPRTGTTPTSLLSDSRLLPQYGMSQSRSESSKALTISEPSPLSPLDPYSLGATRSWTGLGSRLEVLQLF